MNVKIAKLILVRKYGNTGNTFVSFMRVHDEDLAENTATKIFIKTVALHIQAFVNHLHSSQSKIIKFYLWFFYNKRDIYKGKGILMKILYCDQSVN